ncbi:MAG: type II toxin-antitoxin system prevent-host-death family antitoxin [bacterium]|nr:type II toxin-antitoxin system prevent-host-death family antitoxin [bacterium]
MPHPTTRYLLHEARANLGELVSRVFYTGEEIIIEKNNRPMAKISPVKKEETLSPEERRERFLRLAGAWKGPRGEQIRRDAMRMRRTSKLLRSSK